MGLTKLFQEDIVLGEGTDNLVRGDFRYPEFAEKLPIIVICHSFMAFKDWGFFPYIGEELARAGFCTFAFNFSHNGVGSAGGKITELDRFEANTFSTELADCLNVVRAIREENFGKGKINPDCVILLGHSRGGGIAIVTAARSRDVKGLITLSAISTFDRWTPHQKERWRKLGHLPLAKDTTANPLRLGIGLLDDLEKNGYESEILRSAALVKVPWLLLHSVADKTVRVKEAEALYEASNKNSTELVLVEKAGHLFNAANANEDNYVTLNKTLEIITAWLHRLF